MRPLPQVLERYDRFWEQAEHYVRAWFDRHPPPDGNDASASAPDDAPTNEPDLKELNTVITILKRIQDARRAVQLDAMKLEALPVETESSHQLDHPEISRILQFLHESDDSTEPDADSV